MGPSSACISKTPGRERFHFAYFMASFTACDAKAYDGPHWGNLLKFWMSSPSNVSVKALQSWILSVMGTILNATRGKPIRDNFVCICSTLACEIARYVASHCMYMLKRYVRNARMRCSRTHGVHGVICQLCMCLL